MSPLEPRHTPGPWRQQPGSPWIKGPEGQFIAHVEWPDDPYWLPQLVETETAKANARLIVAAPVMLTALRAAEIALEMNVRSGDQATLASVRAAVAKAEGREGHDAHA